MPSLAALVASQVASEVRSRGDEYYRSRRVVIDNIDGPILYASVRGSSHYDVELELDGSDLVARCTCPYATDRLDPCKHIWATILVATERGFGSNVAGKLALVTEDYDDEDEDPYAEDDPAPRPRSTTRTKPKPIPKPIPVPKETWLDHLAAVEREARPVAPSYQWNGRAQGANELRYLYLVDIPASQVARKVVIQVVSQQKKRDGDWGKPNDALGEIDMARLTDPLDRRILALIGGADRVKPAYQSYYPTYKNQALIYQLRGELFDTVLPHLVESGRVRLRTEPKSGLGPLPMTLDDGPPWQLALRIEKDDAGTKYRIVGRLHRGAETMTVSKPDLLIPGAVYCGDTLARFDDGGGYPWVPVLWKKDAIEVPVAAAEQLIPRIMAIPRPRDTVIPDELKFEEVVVDPVPRLVVKLADRYGFKSLQAELTFRYGESEVAREPFTPGIVQADLKRVVRRNEIVEREAYYKLLTLGLYNSSYNGKPTLEMQANRFAKLVKDAMALGWIVEAEGKLYRQAGHFEMNVKSGTDWFDLAGGANFDGNSVPLPRLLAALRKGEKTIVLDDGSLGMVPDEWLKKYGIIAQMGQTTGETIRFAKAQVGVLDALLASRPEIEVDKLFEKARNELKKFEGVEPADPPAAFTGELRGYQREGLGWLRFLRKFGFGGCLADDMGLGKTVQVLAHLASKRKGPALVVVPKSLIFNWKQEAARFTPKLKVLDHTGLTREKSTDAFAKHDIVLTTYGTLRRDAALIGGFRFDTCILDESQAAKNANTDTAKSVKLIQADHRLALSGTPIENHLGELWTLFDFLNPGMLGRAGAFGSEAGSLRNPNPETRELLAKALKPFILRRTKAQVAKDLPEKTEQTLFCELESEQRKLYDELRDHYRIALLSKVDELGLKRTKIQVLAALLRLRQAACHPGLIDEKRVGDNCAKLDALLPQIQEVIEEGHKALVFSQFTSFLAIAKYRFDDLGLDYEYLDGKTRDRAARVERFQTDPDCRLFLVSLKAGGVGLNLTAADYVYLLDPWWNPAVEAQAIDRTHRIGQNKPVFAYRMIAKNTVEEKVLELQKKKKSLADSILDGDGRLITELKREDLELLLS